MGRRRGFTATLMQVQREAERRQRQELQIVRRAEAEAERARKAYEQAAASDEKERTRLYVESRAADVAGRNAGLALEVVRLTSVLAERVWTLTTSSTSPVSRKSAAYRPGMPDDWPLPTRHRSQPTSSPPR